MWRNCNARLYPSPAQARPPPGPCLAAGTLFGVRTVELAMRRPPLHSAAPVCTLWEPQPGRSRGPANPLHAADSVSARRNASLRQPAYTTLSSALEPAGNPANTGNQRKGAKCRKQAAARQQKRQAERQLTSTRLDDPILGAGAGWQPSQRRQPAQGCQMPQTGCRRSAEAPGGTPRQRQQPCTCFRPDATSFHRRHPRLLRVRRDDHAPARLATLSPLGSVGPRADGMTIHSCRQPK